MTSIHSYSFEQLKDLLDHAVLKYNSIEFIHNDPIFIPHRFTKKEDIEISALISATLAWGNRKSIIQSASKFIEWMDNSPHDFILHHSVNEKLRFNKFVHRTFNSDDAHFFIETLANIYSNHGGLEKIVTDGYCENGIFGGLANLSKVFFSIEHLHRTEKHLSNPNKNSACKRLNMFLRWMIRKDDTGVDFGLWNNISKSNLMCPLDVHSANIARKFGLLKRPQNDWKAVVELTENLKSFCAEDPVKYDFALFGIGVSKDF